VCQSALDALILGRQFLATHGWTRYKEVRVDSGMEYYCAVGALKYGAFFWPEKDGIGGFTLSQFEAVYKEALAALDEAARKIGDFSHANIFWLNDVYANDRETVLIAYDMAIQGLREKIDA